MFKLFHLLGCLPDGIKKQHLEKLCPDLDITEGLKALEALDFTEPDDDDEKICLTSFLLKFAAGSIAPEDEKSMMEMIGEFYTEFLSELYRVNSALEM